MACHKSNYQLKKKKHYQKYGCGPWEGGRDGKTNMEGGTDLIFLTIGMWFQQIIDN